MNSGERSAVITAKDIDNLTLVSRNVSELLKVLPGVTSVASGQGSNGLGFDFSNASSTGSAIGVGLSTNGAPYRGGSMLLLDGANVIDPGCNCWSTAVVNPEFTQEVKVATSNFAADQPNGPVVFTSISKSGTDSIMARHISPCAMLRSMQTPGRTTKTTRSVRMPHGTIPAAASEDRSIYEEQAVVLGGL